MSERFFRALKEQTIYGRVFKNAEEVRQAVARFVESYNRSWRLERLGYRSPLEYRQAYLTRGGRLMTNLGSKNRVRFRSAVTKACRP